MPSAVLQRYYRFESFGEFDAFDALLTQQVATGRLLAIPAPAETEQSLPYQADSYYQAVGGQEI